LVPRHSRRHHPHPIDVPGSVGDCKLSSDNFNYPILLKSLSFEISHAHKA
jgi:hypothetical protein